MNKVSDPKIKKRLTGRKRSVCTDYVTNSMEQSPSREANSRSASREIPRIVLNTKAQYSVHKILQLVPILSQMHPVHILPSYFP